MTVTFKGKYSTADVFADEVDEGCAAQIMGMLNSPAITNPVKIMPDFHVGKGSVIGFTMEVGEYIIPNVVGVDIGCGMLTAGIGSPIYGSSDVDSLVRRAIPLGFNVHKETKLSPTNDAKELANKVGMDLDRLQNSLGTLGGGNHFIEFGRDDRKDLYVTIHSGSRQFGLKVAEFHQNRAIEFCKKEGIKVDKELAFCPASEYLEDMRIAQRYASENRQMMLELILHALDTGVLNQIECVHNYIDDDNIIRKGAVNARLGEPIILPFNRTDGIWIMNGLDNPEWNYSAPHGAGRTMSRSEAKRNLTQEQVDTEMNDSGVFSSHNPVDEAPQAYKKPEDIQKYIGETAKLIFKIKPILNIKG